MLQIKKVNRSWLYLIVVFFFLGACNTLGGKTEKNEKYIQQLDKVREPAVAGQWYPENEKQLRELVSDYINNASKIGNLTSVYGIMAPHAGYVFSGEIAGAAYKQVQGRDFETAIIIGPSHREYVTGASVYDGDGFKTPLGVAVVDKELAQKIANQDGRIRLSEIGHRAEHSIEAQVPFLQVALSSIKIVPIAMCDYTWDNCETLAEAILKSVGDKRVLLVASTDLYHGSSYEECKKSDSRTLAKIVEFNPKALCEGLEREYSACGGGPVAVVQYVSKKMGADKALTPISTS